MQLVEGDIVIELGTRISTRHIWMEVKRRKAHFVNTGFDVCTRTHARAYCPQHNTCTRHISTGRSLLFSVFTFFFQLLVVLSNSYLVLMLHSYVFIVYAIRSINSFSYKYIIHTILQQRTSTQYTTRRNMPRMVYVGQCCVDLCSSVFIFVRCSSQYKMDTQTFAHTLTRHRRGQTNRWTWTVLEEW
jgi:hypothetical protein